jgi:cobalt-precorrin 5A hydrolase
MNTVDNCPVDDKKVDIFSLTDRGNALAKQLRLCLANASHYHRIKPFAAKLRSSFLAGHRVVFIGSTGIIIRALAPVLVDKHQDPAVVVISESTDYVIPLLSGHEGGGQQFAEQIAQAISSTCVVTSHTDYRHPIYTLGMGCDRGCPLAMLVELYDQHVPESIKSRVIALASIDIKAEEPALLALAKTLQLPFVTFSADRLRTVEDQLSRRSEVVFREVGCYGVAEAAAIVSAQKNTRSVAELYRNKQKNHRATIAVARSYAQTPVTI